MTIMAVITVQHKIPTPKKHKINSHPTLMYIYINSLYVTNTHRWKNCETFRKIKYYSDDGKLRVINFTEK